MKDVHKKRVSWNSSRGKGLVNSEYGMGNVELPKRIRMARWIFFSLQFQGGEPGVSNLKGLVGRIYSIPHLLDLTFITRFDRKDRNPGLFFEVHKQERMV